jgi:antitoxin component of MazEF toxin-antitoxin module
MATVTVKLQKIGNSIRATIPKHVVRDLSLRQAERMDVNVVDLTQLF